MIRFTVPVLILLNTLLLPSLHAQYATQMTVAQDGSGDYTSIQQAIDNCKTFPDKRITIYVKSGVYREKVKVHSWNNRITLKGENAETTIITWNDHFNQIAKGRNSTFYTYTVLVQGEDFRAENLTIENTAGPVGQAVALAVEADRCVFRNCRILGYQDTLYVAGSNSRQYFDSCYIAGTTDFIFGAATALFERCTVHSKSNSYITAASTPEGKPFGFVFRNCRLSADPGVDSVYLGRPWRDYARVVFLQCEMGAHILPEGWANWVDTERFKTAFFGEYANTGPGAITGRRVTWSHLFSRKQARKYTLAHVLAPIFPQENGAGKWVKEGF